MSDHDNLLRDWAYHYHDRGFSVIPLPHRSKIPTPGFPWKRWQQERPNKAQLKEWFEDKPDQNIAIITGKVSNLVVVDIDSPEGAKALEQYIHPDVVTQSANTPRGKHLYFRHPGFWTRNNAGAIPGCDFRGDGGYVVAPPSAGENGAGYRWPPQPDLKNLAELPQKYLTEVLGIDNKVTTTRQQGDNTRQQVATSELNQVLAEMDRDSASGGNSGTAFAIKDQKILINDNSRETTKKAVTTSVGTQPPSPTDLPHGKKLTLVEGTRDTDLFYVAACLKQGGMSLPNAQRVVLETARACKPPFPDREAIAKVRSAYSGPLPGERNFTSEVVDWVTRSSGSFSSADVYQGMVITTRREKKVVTVILGRMVEAGAIERVGSRNGWFRKIENEEVVIDWQNAGKKTFPIKWPFEVERLVNIHPKNIIVVAGGPDAGKTAFLMNVVRLNMRSYRNRMFYFSSEMGEDELGGRIEKFNEAKGFWEFTAIDRGSNYADVIRPDDINIIDFLEISKEFWLVNEEIKKVYDKLRNGIAIIAIQKKFGAEMGRGAEFGMEKARLYLSMDPGKTKILKAKNWADGAGNPHGRVFEYHIVDGCKFVMKQKRGLRKDDQKLL